MAPKRYSLFGVPIGQWLAVLAIVTFISVALYPIYKGVDRGARPQPSCQSNMKELGLALIQYTEDSDEQYPTGLNAAGNGWAGQLYPYMFKSVGVYQCPKDPHDGNYISYAENRNIVGQSLTKFAAPTATVELYEATTLNCDPSTPETVSATGTSAPQDSTRHNLNTFALNFLLADGHVKMLTPGQVSGGPNAVPPKRKGAAMATFAIK